MWKLCILIGLFKIVRGGSLGDESDLIIRTILANYEPQAHPNSDREDGAVEVEIGVNPLSFELVIISDKNFVKNKMLK